MDTDTREILAFAALYQAAKLTHDIATTGKCSYKSYKALVDLFFHNNLLSSNMDNPIRDIHTIQSLGYGLRTCSTHLNIQSLDSDSLQVNRYVALLCSLEAKLEEHDDVIQIPLHIQDIEEIAEDFDAHSEVIIEKLAQVYQSQISRNAAPIMIRGTQGHLQNPFYVAKIRCLLLCGFRFAMLWRHMGGSRWRLLFKRKYYIQRCLRLLIHEQSNLPEQLD